MIRNIVNGALFLGLLATVLMTWFLRRDYTQRNDEFLPGMVVSVPFNAQDPNVNFLDKKTLQSSDKNNIAKGYFPLHYRATAEDAVRASEELVNPLSDSIDAERERGEKVFTTFCQPCHGAGGVGDGNVVKRGFPPPPSLLADHALKLKDGQLFHIITYGQGNMSSLVSQVNRLDRWRVINHIRSLQKKTLVAGK
ncbi:MAG TPA: cytochrome c [Bacteroidota bacterium]|nr:cytochrome c [Bacteroidota bacterium]